MAWWMYFMLLLYVGACLFLIMVILLQSGKGGGLSSLGSASPGISDALGATSTERALTKLTTVCAILFVVLAISISWLGAQSMRVTDDLLPEGPAATAPATTLEDLPDAPGAIGTQPEGVTGLPEVPNVQPPVMPITDQNPVIPIEPGPAE